MARLLRDEVPRGSVDDRPALIAHLQADVDRYGRRTEAGEGSGGFYLNPAGKALDELRAGRRVYLQCWLLPRELRPVGSGDSAHVIVDAHGVLHPADRDGHALDGSSACPGDRERGAR